MAKTFDLTKISSGKTALEVKNKVLAEKPVDKNSKILENNSQILESKAEVVSPAQEKLTLKTVQEQAATRTETAQGEAQTPTLPNTPENSKSVVLERPLNNGVQTEYKQGTEQSTKLKQTEYNQSTNGVQNWTYFQIKGNEKKLLDFVFLKCDQIASRISPPLSPEVLASVYGEPNLKNKNTAKVCMRRLVTDKKMLKRLGSVCGRGGYTQVELSEHLFLTIKQNLSEYKPSTNGVQTDNKQGTQQGTQQGTNGSSKVDSNFNNNLTNYPEGLDWFKHLDFKPIDPIRPMQVNQSIRTLVVQSLSQDQAQDFINRFQSWAATQGKINNPLAFFCDKLKEFASNKDSAVLSHKTEDERKLEA